MLGGGHSALKRECVGWRAWAAKLSLFFKKISLFIYSWLHRVFIAAGISLVGMCGLPVVVACLAVERGLWARWLQQLQHSDQ